MPKQVSMSIDELLALPATFPVDIAGRAWGMGRHKAARLADEGNFPVPVQKLGQARMCTKADLFRSLGLHLDGTPIDPAVQQPA